MAAQQSNKPISDLERLYRSAMELQNSRGRQLAEGGFLFKKDDGTFRFFQKYEELVSFEFCQDELL